MLFSCSGTQICLILQLSLPQSWRWFVLVIILFSQKTIPSGRFLPLGSLGNSIIDLTFFIVSMNEPSNLIRRDLLLHTCWKVPPCNLFHVWCCLEMIFSVVLSSFFVLYHRTYSCFLSSFYFFRSQKNMNYRYSILHEITVDCYTIFLLSKQAESYHYALHRFDRVAHYPNGGGTCKQCYTEYAVFQIQTS